MKYRVRFGEVIADLIEPSTDKNLGKGIIVFQGLPKQSNSEKFGEMLAKEGFYVLQPRYIGSWESYGSFSIENCIKTVVESEEFFLKGEGIELYGEKRIYWNIDEIFIIGSSFAASIILSIADKLRTKNFVFLGPLINLRKHNSNREIKEQNLSEFYGFLKRGFENAFRGLSEKDWKNFISGKLKVNPMKSYSLIKDKNILLIHGGRDEIVNISRTEEYYRKIRKNNSVELRIYPHLSHGRDLRMYSYNYFVEWMKGK